MGSGEYGGNGSVHWHIHNERDRNHGKGKSHHRYDEVDEYPGETEGGDFTVLVFDIGEKGFYWDKGKRLLTVTLPIKHGAAFTRQILVTWPDPPGTTLEGGWTGIFGARKKPARPRKK